MNNAGEIKELAKIAKPDIALITNVSSSHIQNFKNEKEIARAKVKFSGLKKNGTPSLTQIIFGQIFIITNQKGQRKIHLYGHDKNSNTNY